jgi:plasmid stability protein
MRSESQLKNDDKDKYVLRFREDGQRSYLKARAAQNHRSLNAEILCLIDQALKDEATSKEQQ